ncbi:MAG: Uma2 family endonuclease [Pyrinomonadaceae bacterium]
MTAKSEVEKIPNPPLMRKKFRTDEVYQMMEMGILPEESGWELIDGEIIERMTIGSRHASIVRRLEKYLERNFGDFVMVSGQNPIHIDEHNEPEPDIALLKPREDFYAEKHPAPDDVLLVIEVSDSTLEYDRETKKTLFAEAGIGEFWLVNLKQNTIETYSNPANGTYYQMRIFERGELVQTKYITGVSLEVNKIFGEDMAESEMEN